MSLHARWSGALDELRMQKRNRAFRLPRGHDFTSNDYLGYATAQANQSANTGTPGREFDSSPSLIAQVEHARSGTSSRLLRGQHEVWDEVESLLASWHRAEAVLMMTSGYAANEGLLATIAEPGDWVAADELSHACLIDGLRLARPRKFLFRHNDLNHLEDGLKAEAAKRPEGRELFIATESLFSMDGDTAPLAEIVALAERYGAHVLVDEAHSTGCFGPHGSGSVDAAGLRERVLATIHTGGKALGLTGAYIGCSQLLKEFLINKCRHLIFTTALPAAIGSWWQQQIPRVQHEDERRQRLHANVAFFREALAKHGLTPPGSHYVVPVIVGQDEPTVRAAAKLQEQGYDVRAIRPPTVPQGSCRLRISVHANHDTALLAQLAEHVAQALHT